MKKNIYINQKSNSQRNAVYTASWDVESLETFFKSATLPKSVNLNGWTKITNVQGFINSHLEYVKANNGNRLYMPYFDRLQVLQQILIG
jgi:hypothetical protein